MIAQTVLVALTALVALAYLGRRAWRTWASKGSGCSGGCGCAKPKKAESPGLIRAEELLSRVRERAAAK